jgi:hypothetical protein
MTQLEKIEELENEIRILKGLTKTEKAKAFSDVSIEYLKELKIVKQNFIEKNKFDSWFNNQIIINDDVVIFLEKLLDRYGMFLNKLNEDRLKVVFIGQILEHVNFLDKELEIGNFYHSPLSFKNDKINFSGFCDFYVAKGIDIPENPYFFIQEFKQEKGNTEPEPQLVAELISAVEINNINIIKGAYIKGAIWRFVILEKLEDENYQYFVSQNFDSTKIEDLKDIYKNLLFVKNEIIEMVKNGE